MTQSYGANEKAERKSGRAIDAWVRALRLTAPIATQPEVTLPVLLDRLGEALGDRPALLADSACLTYAGLADRTRRYARWALGQGLGRGDVVALIMPNCPDYVAIWLGITRVGAAVALVNASLAADGLIHSINVVAPRHIIVAAELADRLHAVMPSLGGAPRCWVHGADDPALPRIEPEIERLSGAPMGDETPQARLTDRALCIYTSGTTGLPKAANISHSRVMQWTHWFAGLMDITPEDRLYNCLPMYHSIGGIVAVGAPLVAGASVVIRKRFSASRFWDEVTRWDCTLFQYIGELCRYLLQSPADPQERAHRLRLCCGNGLRADVWEPFKTRFGIPQILEYYAATEANFSLYNCEGKVGAIGRIPGFLAHRLPVALIKVDLETSEPVRGDDGFAIRCDADEVGEAVSRIPDDARAAAGRFEGYTDQAASDRKILRGLFATGDAWYRSGDLMQQDDERYFYFVDRLGDAFRWKGENVSAAAVAAAIASCPGVTECVAYGVLVPGNEGRAGMVAIVADDRFDLAAFRRHVVERLPSYARPLFVRLCRDVATTATFRPKAQESVAAGL